MFTKRIPVVAENLLVMKDFPNICVEWAITMSHGGPWTQETPFPLMVYVIIYLLNFIYYIKLFKNFVLITL